MCAPLSVCACHDVAEPGWKPVVGVWLLRPVLASQLTKTTTTTTGAIRLVKSRPTGGRIDFERQKLTDGLAQQYEIKIYKMSTSVEGRGSKLIHDSTNWMARQSTKDQFITRNLVDYLATILWKLVSDSGVSRDWLIHIYFSAYWFIRINIININRLHNCVIAKTIW